MKDAKERKRAERRGRKKMEKIEWCTGDEEEVRKKKRRCLLGLPPRREKNF